MADEQGPWTDTNLCPRNADRGQRDSLFCMPCKKLRVFVGSHIFHKCQQTSKDDNICESIMEDSRDTVIMRVPDEQLEGEDFVKFFSKAGTIKTGGNTGQRMALMRLIKDKMTGINLHEGIVTYNDPGAAMKAVKNLNGKILNGHHVIVKGAEDFFIESGEKPVNTEGKDILDSRGRDDNTAWRCWLKADRQIIARGGRGGKPAVSGGWFSGWFSGSKGGDGEGGEPGPHGGRGGEGGKGQG